MFPVRVKNYNGEDYLVLVVRIGDRLFAVGGECTYEEPVVGGDHGERNAK